MEVEWLIHLTDTRTLPGAPTLSDVEKDYLRATVSFDKEGRMRVTPAAVQLLIVHLTRARRERAA